MHCMDFYIKYADIALDYLAWTGLMSLPWFLSERKKREVVVTSQLHHNHITLVTFSFGLYMVIEDF